MIILRRAGLLDYRNQRVLRLNASLARGKHHEIEDALAQLVQHAEGTGNNNNEAEGAGEEDSTAIEAELLDEVAQETGEDTSSVPTERSSIVPDTQRELAVIRGLSALGELRLPLGTVLSLLTSKLLWEAFYKRLYHWYGSIDATQTVTAEDIEAAILSAYPEHTANTLVAQASATFVCEVELAINFSATLPACGWQGSHLRLHQADAARRMTEVLQRQKDLAFLLNADDPGMGKSAAFLAAVAASGIQSVVLVAPKTVADDTWFAPTGEIARCLPQARWLRGIRSIFSATPLSGVMFFILHYEELLDEHVLAQVTQRQFDCLCIDETHLIKQRADQKNTQRREAIAKLRGASRTAIGLTGTPLVNELAEPLSILQTLSQHAPQFEYTRLRNHRLGDAADVFETMLPYVIRRRKHEVLLHLPDCNVRLVELSLPTDIDEQMRTIAQWPKARAGQALVELRKLATDAKLPYIYQRAQTTSKLLVLTYLTDDVSEKIASYLDDFLPGCIVHINGQVAREERQRLIDAFRASSKVRVLVGTIGTIGAGLTLFDPKQETTASDLLIADLPYTWAEFEQGIARLHREGQKQRVTVDVLQTTTMALLHDGSPFQTLDQRLWEFIVGKRDLSDIAIDGKYETNDADEKVQKALRRWLKHARDVGVEPLSVERRSSDQSEAQRWRGEIARLRGMSAAKADELFADQDYTHTFLEHVRTSPASKLAHAWLRGKLSRLLRSNLDVIDMGCGLNPFANLPCHVIGLDRHNLPSQLRGKMENPPLPDASADVLIYSLSLYGTTDDLRAYFFHAQRILRGGGHLLIVEPASAFTSEGLIHFISDLQQFGFELVKVQDLRAEDNLLLKGLHLTLTGPLGKPAEATFDRK